MLFKFFEVEDFRERNSRACRLMLYIHLAAEDFYISGFSYIIGSFYTNSQLLIASSFGKKTYNKVSVRIAIQRNITLIKGGYFCLLYRFALGAPVFYEVQKKLLLK
jgi:hypothetical protein